MASRDWVFAGSGVRRVGPGLHGPARSGAPDALVDDVVSELGARAHAELPEHLAQVVVHGVRTDEQLGGNVPVRVSSAHEGGDLRFLRCELLRGPDIAPPGMLTGGSQLSAGPLGEAAQAHCV